MHSRSVVGVACLFALCAAVSVVQAETIVYLSDRGPGEASPGMPLLGVPEGEVIEPGTTGELNIYIQTTDLLAGVALDLHAEGDAIRFTSSSVADVESGDDDRWSFTTDGDVSDNSVTGMEGGALVGISGLGLGVTREDGDQAFDPTSGFLFGTVGWEAVTDLATSELRLGIGANTFGAGPPIDGVFDGQLTPIRLGGPDGDVVGNVGGEVSGFAGKITVGIPEPSTIMLAALACVGVVGLTRRRS